jgi:hypothetical protein
MPYGPLALLLAAAIAAVNLGELAWFSNGYLPRQMAAIALWAGLPAPVAYLLGARTLRSGWGARILIGAMALALGVGLFGAWDVLLGPGREEPLNGLIVVVAPTYQNAVLALGLVAAWIAEWRIRAWASRA